MSKSVRILTSFAAALSFALAPAVLGAGIVAAKANGIGWDSVVVSAPVAAGVAHQSANGIGWD
ncbi:hypothetical protein [Kitasatospora sp. McL0602]|uniref:hypothetical protein n=1 Tax=Kitasatospora sp. McL0602 TaxID=3439530 RepID=UPI003F8896C5